jgi:hypothetical protein
VNAAHNWKVESNAPEGWRLVGNGERGRSTWLTDEDELVLVPVQVETCCECHGEGAIEDDDATDEWSRCPDCDGEGYIEGSEEYDFEHAVSKGTALKVARLHTIGKGLSEWEWWVDWMQP